MNDLERFIAVMEYKPVDRVPNWELGVWPQTIDRWEKEGCDIHAYHWDWFTGEDQLGMDGRQFIRFYGDLLPQFEEEILAEDERTITFKDGIGRTRKALKEGTSRGGRLSMDTYLEFPVKTMSDWQQLKPRLQVTPVRYEPYWEQFRIASWKTRTYPLIFGPNCALRGFYWFTRDLMGTEPLSYALYDQPELIHDIMEFHADFMIEAIRPILEKTTIDYVVINEDLSMKTGPLISPKSYKTFIYPRLKRVIEFMKGHGVRYFGIDTDGNPEVLVPVMMEAGMDVLWPLERAADQDPVRLRQKFGKSLRLWGGVDKRVLAEGPDAIDNHLRAMQPLVVEGGFIPTVDHTVPPDVSWANFQYYLSSKEKMLRGIL